MAFEERLENITLEAAVDLSAKQYFFVAQDANGRAVLAGNGANAEGVLQNAPDLLGKAASVAVSGTSKVVAGAAIALNAKVASDAAGKAKTAASGNRVLGVAREAALADGDIISVLLKLEGEPNA